MAKNWKTPDMNLPVWFDGQNINEALFCEEFLQERRIIFANGAFFTPDGRVTDDLPLRGEIYDKLNAITAKAFKHALGVDDNVMLPTLSHVQVYHDMAVRLGHSPLTGSQFFWR